jgi:hypothetical protein
MNFEELQQHAFECLEQDNYSEAISLYKLGKRFMGARRIRTLRRFVSISTGLAAMQLPEGIREVTL